MRKLGMGVLIGGLRQNSATFLKPNQGSYEFSDYFLTPYHHRAEEISPRRTPPRPKFSFACGLPCSFGKADGEIRIR
jgi:hypothetical protein